MVSHTAAVNGTFQSPLEPENKELKMVATRLWRQEAECTALVYSSVQWGQ